MGCLRVKQLNDYLIDPIKKALNDYDPYVRKTAGYFQLVFYLFNKLK